MARSGVYKSDIQKARDALLAEGKRPSIDAVRIALGNTGSKATIHRYLKELEAEGPADGGSKIAVSDALQDLVGRLAGRLHEEADARIAEEQARFDKTTAEQSDALAEQARELMGTREQLQRTEVALHNERAAHETTRQALTAAQLEVAQLGERVTGLELRLQEQEAHVVSLDEKHRHAREALDHFRTAAKEQREQEQRRHEHQVQALQAELRQAADTLRDKTQAILDLNRDNARLIEQQTRLDRELTALQTQTRQQQQELEALRPLDAEVKGLMARSAQEIATAEQLRVDVGRLNGDLAGERALRREAEIEAAIARARLDALEPLLRRIGEPDVPATRAFDQLAAAPEATSPDGSAA